MRSFYNHDTKSLRGFLHLDFTFAEEAFKFLTVKDLEKEANLDVKIYIWIFTNSYHIVEFDWELSKFLNGNFFHVAVMS